MKGRLRKYSDGWFIEEIVNDNGVKLPQPSRIKVHPEQLTNDDPYRTKYGVDDEVHFEVRTIAMGDSEFNVMDEDVALIIDTNEGVNEGLLPVQPMSPPDGIGVLSSMDIVEPTPTKIKESKLYSDIAANKNVILRNQQLMQLEEPIISTNEKMKILDRFREPNKKFEKMEFFKVGAKYKILQNWTDINDWLKSTFSNIIVK